jgi:hypothetical protein
MKNILTLFFIVLLLRGMALAFEPAYDADNPQDIDRVPVIQDGPGIASTMTRWKSSRIQASASGRVTHFIIRIGSANVESVPVGFAVYSGTAGESVNQIVRIVGMAPPLSGL